MIGTAPIPKIARLRSPSPMMVPGITPYKVLTTKDLFSFLALLTY